MTDKRTISPPTVNQLVGNYLVWDVVTVEGKVLFPAKSILTPAMAQQIVELDLPQIEVYTSNPDEDFVLSEEQPAKISGQVDTPKKRTLSTSEMRWNNFPAVLNAMRQLDPMLNNFFVVAETEDVMSIGLVNREDLSENAIQRLLGVAELLRIYGECVIYPEETVVVTLWRTDVSTGPVEDSPEDFSTRFSTLWRLLLPLATYLTGECELNVMSGGKAVMLSSPEPLDEWTLPMAKNIAKDVEVFGVRAEVVTNVGYRYWVRVMERPIE
jgi:hypothetical protein